MVAGSSPAPDTTYTRDFIMKTIVTIIFVLILLATHNSDFAKEIIAESKNPTLDIYVFDKTKDIQDDETSYYLVTNTNQFYKVSFKTYYSTELHKTRTINNPTIIEQLYAVYIVYALIYLILLFFINGYQKEMF